MTCPHCVEPITADDATERTGNGEVLHRECLIRMVAGSAAHQLHECSCYGGDREDPPGLSRRQAARLALQICEGTGASDLIHLTAQALHERAAYIADYAGQIPVRVQIDGRWHTKMLAELDAAAALREGFRLLLRAEIPHRKLN